MTRIQATTLAIVVGVSLAACATPAASPVNSAAPSPTVAASTSAATATASPTASATALTATPATAAQTGPWQQLTTEPIPFLQDVTQGPSGFLGIGMGSDSTDAAPIRAVWRSEDGIAWTEEPYELLLLDTGVVEGLYQVVATDTGYAGLGSPWYGIAVSEDGRTWTYESLGEGACPGAIASNGEVLVAVGSIGPCGMGGALGTPAIWVRDSEGWTLLDAPASGGWFTGVEATPNGFTAWGPVTDSADAWICEIGCRPDPELEPYAGAPWSSPDGRTWRRTSDPVPFAGATIEGIAATGELAAALGWIWTPDGASGQIALWASDDGDRWSMVEGLPFADAPAGAGAGIGAGGDVLAVWARGFGEISANTIWTSSDLVSWEDDELVADLRRISGLGDALIAYGTVPQSRSGESRAPCRKDQVIAGTCRNVGAAWVYRADQ